jgi:hypothetical protein
MLHQKSDPSDERESALSLIPVRSGCPSQYAVYPRLQLYHADQNLRHTSALVGVHSVWNSRQTCSKERTREYACKVKLQAGMEARQDRRHERCGSHGFRAGACKACHYLAERRRNAVSLAFTAYDNSAHQLDLLLSNLCHQSDEVSICSLHSQD